MNSCVRVLIEIKKKNLKIPHSLRQEDTFKRLKIKKIRNIKIKTSFHNNINHIKKIMT
jgi:hypothetical protein